MLYCWLKRSLIVIGLAILFCVFITQTALCQQDSASAKSVLSVKGYFSLLGKNFSEQAAAPFHLKKSGYIEAVTLISSTLILTTLDGKADDEVKTLKNEDHFIHEASPPVTELGGTYGIIGACAFGLAGIIFHDDDIAETGLLATQAIITSGLWAQVGKYISGRERPFRSYEGSMLPGGKWYGPLVEISNPDHLPSSSFSSFPSGHTTTAFAIATVFAMKYKTCHAVSLTAYTLATLVGFSRITENKHWLSDVFAGAALGHLCARQIMKSHFAAKEPSDKKNRSQIFLMPDFSFAPTVKAVLIF